MANITSIDFKLIEENIRNLEQHNSELLEKKVRDMTMLLLNSLSSVTIKPFKNKNICRLSEHFRSTFITFQNTNFSIKGLEPLLSDIDEYLEIFSRRIDLFHPSVGSRFIYNEAKIPFIFLHHEAIEEVEKSKKMVSKYLEVYKTIPKIPIPLAIAVFELPQSLTKKIESLYKVNCSNIKSASVVYLNTTHPSRVGHYDRFFNRNFSSLFEKLDNRKTYLDCELWIETITIEFSRWLNLGFIPSEVGKSHLGSSVKSQNVGMSGGFFDIGSFSQAFEKTDSELLGDIFLSISELIDTICTHVCIDMAMNASPLSKIFYPIVLNSLVKNWPEDIIDNRTYKTLLILNSSNILELAYLIDSCRYKSNEFEEIII